MKKYIVIALAALVAFSACTKTNPEEKKSEKISFLVANYVPQTKANSSLDSEGFQTFNCYAWYFGAPMQYMNNVSVIKGGSEWAPEDDYYWPKTGYINFYSYAGTKAPSVTPSDDMKTVTVAYTDQVIASTDNFMVADPALHFGIAQANHDGVAIDHEQGENFNYTGNNAGKYDYTTSTQSYTGVPTLFHHMLAKVAFVIKLKTAKASDNTSWTVKVLNSDGTETTPAYKSNIEALKKGTLTLESVDVATTASVSSWTVKNATNAAIGWVPGNASEVMPFETVELTLPADGTTKETAIDTLLPIRTVMPQAITSVAFNFVYEVTAKHGDTEFMKEVIKVDKNQLSEIEKTITAWNMNQITLYTITIDPVGQRVTFDPAVVEWDSQTANINIPLPTTTTTGD